MDKMAICNRLAGSWAGWRALALINIHDARLHKAEVISVVCIIASKQLQFTTQLAEQVKVLFRNAHKLS